MPRLWVRCLLFVSSYAPLLWLLAWRGRGDQTVWIPLVAVGVVAVAVLFAVLRVQRNAKGPRLEVHRWRPRDAEVLSYIATYLIPFLALDLSKTDDLVTLVMFLVVLGLVYVNSSMLYVNPVLSVLGYHVYEVRTKDDHEYLLVSRKKSLKGVGVLQPIAVGDYIRLEA